ncbi:hypothetical protein ElyMa_004529100 [Elysia marginata]|uniref:Uncharacterized protein n=1 Tax=Elysia marginata TaxID=1093978 RepID=A0AAV4HNI9_9GAST|nr:hypothetical protein ElyMa_004529100 [Elysia marginata]
MASFVNGSSLVLRSTLPNVTSAPTGDFTTVAPCTSKDCDDDDGEIPTETFRSDIAFSSRITSLYPLPSSPGDSSVIK